MTLCMLALVNLDDLVVEVTRLEVCRPPAAGAWHVTLLRNTPDYQDYQISKPDTIPH